MAQEEESSTIPTLVFFMFIALGILAWAHERNRRRDTIDNCQRMGRSLKRCTDEYDAPAPFDVSNERQGDK